MTLRLFKYLASEDEQSAEFRYLQSVCVARAREVFGDVDLVVGRPGRAEPSTHAVRDGDYVLVLGRENVWFTAETLRRMKAAIDRGAACVSPTRITDHPLHEIDPLYTARDFEQIEQHIEQRLRANGEASRVTAASPPPASQLPVSHLPVSLFGGTAFVSIAASAPVSRLLTDSDAAATLAIETCGVFHQFADYYGETRADLIPYLPAAVEDVLEVGCGRGFTGRLIQQQLGCRVTGVELHPEIAAEAARHLSRVIVGDILTVDVGGRYDAIVASELFEHLADPDAFLLKMMPLLKPGGVIVLSVPNVGHYSVVEDLLAGRWDYVPAGLLCNTHLRFFTRRTLADLMTRLQCEATIVPQITELPERFRQIAAALPSLPTDLDSLRTRGFYVVMRPAPTSSGVPAS
jgi:2-polyprenyl-3-methyl-5-hydroxy-6-metoxy-1,4-benzoquinol methylase